MEQLTLSIVCLTYNQESFIRQCLAGIVEQKTNFRFEAIVHDDASTDGTVNIIKEYAHKFPNIIKPIYENENQYSKHDGSIQKILNKHINGKYVALCEGDDYWIDPFKLQKQVDYMEAHPECGLVHTHAIIYNQAKGKFVKHILKGCNNVGFEKLLIRGNISTLTVCYRNSLMKGYDTEIMNKIQSWTMMLDYPQWLWLSRLSKVHLIPEVTSVYRLLKNSASRNSNYRHRYEFHKCHLKIALLYANQYSSYEMQKKVVNHNFIHILGSIIKYKEFSILKDFINDMNLYLEFFTVANKTIFKLLNVFVKRY